MDSNAVTTGLAVVGLAGIAIALVLRGQYAEAITVAALITPGALDRKKDAAAASEAKKP